MKSLLTTLSILAITGNLTNVILNISSQKIQLLDNKISARYNLHWQRWKTSENEWSRFIKYK